VYLGRALLGDLVLELPDAADEVLSLRLDLRQLIGMRPVPLILPRLQSAREGKDGSWNAGFPIQWS
jgi:hypothetical protein